MGVTKTRSKLKIKRQRCPFCHDDIVPGGQNQACHECLTWHHSECWASHGKCVGCGDEGPEHLGPTGPTIAEVRALSGIGPGPLIAPPEFNPNVDCSPEHDCFVHDRMNAKARADLYAVHGPDADRVLAEMCKRNQPSGHSAGALNALVSAAGRAIVDRLKTPEPTDEIPVGVALSGATCHACHRTYTRRRGMKNCGCVHQKEQDALRRKLKRQAQDEVARLRREEREYEARHLSEWDRKQNEAHMEAMHQKIDDAQRENRDERERQKVFAKKVMMAVAAIVSMVVAAIAQILLATVG